MRSGRALVGYHERWHWLKHAAHANGWPPAAAAIEKTDRRQTDRSVEAETASSSTCAGVIEAVARQGWRLYKFVGATGVRFPCAHGTSARGATLSGGKWRQAWQGASQNGAANGTATGIKFEMLHPARQRTMPGLVGFACALTRAGSPTSWTYVPILAPKRIPAC